MFIAKEEHTNHLRAVKLIGGDLADEPVARAQFRNEFSAVKSINCANVVRVHNYGVTDMGTPWFSMDLIEGDTLLNQLKRPSWRNRLRAMPVLLGIANGLRSAHQHLVHHLDLKPANILIETSGNPVLIDFGCAELATDVASPFGQVARWYTPEYAAPEVRAGHLGRGLVRADVYSFGVVMFEVLTGVAAAKAPTTVDKYRALQRVSRNVRAVCETCLADDPEERFATMNEVHKELTRCATGYPAECRRAWWPVRVGYNICRNPRTWGAFVILSVLTIAGVSFGAKSYMNRVESRIAEEERTRVGAVVRTAEIAAAAARRGDWASAEAGYRAALDGNHPDRPRIEVALLRSQFATNRLDGLAERLDQLLTELEMDPRRAELLLLRGELRFLDSDRSEAALADVRAALVARPPLDSADAAYAHGLVATTATETLDHFRTAVTRDATHRPARAALVMGLLLAGRYNEASAELRTMRSLFPSDPLLLLADGLLALHQGEEAAGLAAFDNFVRDLPRDLAEPLRAQVRSYAAALRAVRELNAAPLGVPANANPNPLANLPDTAFTLFKGAIAARGPLGLPQPVVARSFEWGRVYITGAQLLLARGPMSRVIAVVDPALAWSGDAALFQLSASAHFMKALEYQGPDQKEQLLAELRTTADRAEAAAGAPTGAPFGTFAYQGRTLAAFTLGLLAMPGYDSGDDARLRRNLRELVREGEALPQLRAESVALLLKGRVLSTEQARVLLTDWGLSASGDPRPWERLTELEAGLKNGEAAKIAAARALRANSNDPALKSRLDTLLGTPKEK